MKKSIQVNKSELILMEGDITEIAADAIINAANSQLVLGSGVAGAIREKGGPQIQQECDKIGGTHVGSAVLTTAGELKAGYVIHAVGPRMGEGDEERKLRDATMNSLIIAETHDLHTIAFPAISTGVFGFPIARCAQIMLTVVIEYLKRPTKIKTVYFCLWGKENYLFFEKALNEKVTVTNS